VGFSWSVLFIFILLFDLFWGGGMRMWVWLPSPNIFCGTCVVNPPVLQLDPENVEALVALGVMDLQANDG